VIGAGGIHAGVLELQLRGVLGVYDDYGTQSILFMIGASS
jgi:hypothetical protein